MTNKYTPQNFHSDDKLLKKVTNHFLVYKKKMSLFKNSMLELDKILNHFADKQEEFTITLMNNPLNLRLLVSNFERTVSQTATFITKELKKTKKFRIEGFKSFHFYFNEVNGNLSEESPKLKELLFAHVKNKDIIISMIEKVNECLGIPRVLESKKVISHRVALKLKNSFTSIKNEHFDYLDSNDEAIELIKSKIKEQN